VKRIPADVVVTLDHVRRPDDRDAFDHVRVERPLREKRELTLFGRQPLRFRLEHLDERGADDLALLLRIRHPGEPLEEQPRRIREHQRQLQPLEPPPDLRRFVESHDAVVDEDAGQAIADRLVEEERRHRGVDAAAQAAHDPPLAHLPLDRVHRLLHERRHRPVAAAAADVEREVAEDLGAAIRVCDFGVEQDGVEASILVHHRGHRRVGARRGDGEAGRRALHEIAVARPHAQLGTDRREDRRLFVDADDGVPVFALRRGRDFPAEGIGHQLHAVADAEHGDARLVHDRIAARRGGFRHAPRSAGEHDPDRMFRTDLGDRGVVGEDFGIDRQFPQSARNQLRELRSEIQDDDGLVSHGGRNAIIKCAERRDHHIL
jgi:hypothetical protein